MEWESWSRYTDQMLGVKREWDGSHVVDRLISLSAITSGVSGRRLTYRYTDQPISHNQWSQWEETHITKPCSRNALV